MEKSNSQSRTISLFGRFRYLSELLRLHVQRLRNPPDFDWIADDIATYEAILTERSGKRLQDARVLEIGVGQRPYRLVTMHSTGSSAYGVDLDQPLMSLSWSAFVRLIGRNGLVRGLKTAVRVLLFDRTEYASLERMILRRFGQRMKFEIERVHVGDASLPAVWDEIGGEFDLIYSEDVFEHVPTDGLNAVVQLMANRMTKDGVAVVTPFVFTGISGGHDVGWYPSLVEVDGIRRGPAWGHLTGEGVAADTYLNKLSLADYRAIFSRYLVILREEVRHPDMGRRHLTEERRAKLGDYSEDELFSNAVRFVLAKRNG